MSEQKCAAKKKLTRRQAKFLKEYCDLGNISKAAEAAGVARRCHYEWIRDDESVYREEFASLSTVANGLLIDEAHRRAYNGVDEPVFYMGEKIATVTKYSDTLLIFLIKATGGKFRDRREVTIRTEDMEKMSDDELRKIIASEE